MDDPSQIMMVPKIINVIVSKTGIIVVIMDDSSQGMIEQDGAKNQALNNLYSRNGAKNDPS